MKLQWYINRLQAMSLPEIVNRTQLALKKKTWQRRTTWIAPKPKIIPKDTWKLPHLPSETMEECESLLTEANDYLQGKYTLLNLSFTEPKINWHLDPQTGKIAPLEFGLNLNYRDPNIAGNVKNIWEKNRHHHLTILALAYAITNNEQYVKAIEEQLLDWIEKNPFPLGVNWASSLEFGIRLISWVWIERLIRNTSTHTNLFGEDGKLWQTIYWHQWLIAQHYSHGSSANNHLIGEMAGLFLASSLLPVFPESSKWQSLARKILEEEVSRQTFPSGINREQAFSYQIFALEFFLLAGIEAQRINVPFSANYKDWVRRMLEVIPSLVDVGGNLPQYGDGDDGMALQLRPNIPNVKVSSKRFSASGTEVPTTNLKSSRLDWLFRLGRQWLNAQVPLPSNKSGLLPATLIGIEAKDEIEEVKPPQNSIGFDDAGIFVLTSQRGKPDEVFCLADAGCLGFLSIAAHGHADALSFTLSVGGKPVIIDPGTYIYHAETQWRNYFRSTKAHNTIVIDNLDQSEPSGIFLWTKKAEVKVLSWEAKPDGGVLIAQHDGYQRLPNGVTHRRRLSLEGKKLEIQDVIGELTQDLTPLDPPYPPSKGGLEEGSQTPLDPPYPPSKGGLEEESQTPPALPGQGHLAPPSLAGKGAGGLGESPAVSLELRLHFAPECDVSLQKNTSMVSWQGGSLEINLDAQMEWLLTKGEPEAGWYSPGFNLKIPTYTLIGSLRSHSPITLNNYFNIL